jgi:hypothetical protein
MGLERDPGVQLKIGTWKPMFSKQWITVQIVKNMKDFI